ncbi:tyrosine-type recombinase/integrase, partial [Bacillus cereus]
QIKEYLKEKNERNYILFVMGINTGLRISDILKLKVGDVQGSHISMREMKTGKQKRIQITSSLKRELKWFNEGREDEEYLLKSRKGKNRPIGRSMAYKILKSTAAEFGLDEIGTHTL